MEVESFSDSSCTDDEPITWIRFIEFSVLCLICCGFVMFRRCYCCVSHGHNFSHSQTTAIFARNPRTCFSAKSIMNILVRLIVLPRLRCIYIYIYIYTISTHQFEIILVNTRQYTESSFNLYGLRDEVKNFSKNRRIILEEINDSSSSMSNSSYP